MSVNKFIGIGNLTKDPEIRYMKNGEAVANCAIACNEKWKNKAGEKQESVEYINLVFYRKLAEIVGEYLKKGSQVYVEGRLQTRKWQDKEGHERYTTEIVADRMQMLGSRGDAESGITNITRHGVGDYTVTFATESASAPAGKSGGGFDDLEDDIPFN